MQLLTVIGSTDDQERQRRLDVLAGVMDDEASLLLMLITREEMARLLANAVVGDLGIISTNGDNQGARIGVLVMDPLEQSMFSMKMAEDVGLDPQEIVLSGDDPPHEPSHDERKRHAP